jgi:hypothetical protein
MSIVGNIKLRGIQAREKRVEDSLAANVAPSFLPASSIGQGYPRPGPSQGALASALIALTGAGYQEAAQTLKALAERATRRRRESGVA